MRPWPAVLWRKTRTLLRLLREAISGPPAPATAIAAVSAEDVYQDRIARELHQYADCANVHELPAIFHYWSNKHLAPMFESMGIQDPEHFYLVHVQKFHQRFPDHNIRIASVGCGNCDMEVRLARRLLDAGITHFNIICLDINQAMLDRGKLYAAELQVSDYIETACADFNRWQPTQQYDLVLANQCLHHVMELENLFETIRGCLNPEGYLLTCDMIGRNGHQRWPEASKLIEEFWQELPTQYRYNHWTKRVEMEYINHDCSTHSFEGIRAQDILPLLIKYFHFEFFLPYSNIIAVFIDRTFGHNFNAQAEWDKDFIDRVHARDEQGILSGELKPTQMLAALRIVPVPTALVDPRLTPEFCVRVPG